MKFSNTTYWFYPSDEEKLSEYKTLPEDLVDVSEEDLNKFNSGEIGPLVHLVDGALTTRVVEKTGEENLQDFRKSVQAELNFVSSIGLQCYMAGIDFPADWKAYRTELIALSKVSEYSDNLVLPTQPPLPSNI
jgi:hypothetical protein